MNQPHDRIVKIVFESPRRTRDLLEFALGKDDLAMLELGDLELVPASFIGLDMRERFSDLLFKTTACGDVAYVYILFQHKSRASFRLPIEMLDHHSRLLGHLSRELTEEEELPIVLPFVLVHDIEREQKITRLDQIEPSNPRLDTFLGVNRLRYGVKIIDLSTLDDRALLEGSSDDLVALITLFLKHGRTHPDIIRLVTDVADVIRRILNRGERFFLEELIGYIAAVNQMVDPYRLAQEVERVDPELGVIAMSVMDKYREQWKREGHEEGRQEGRQEGQRYLLHSLLEARFGILDTRYLDRLMKASNDELTRWATAVLAASSIEEVFEA